MYASAQKLQKVQQYPQEYKQLERNLSEVRDHKPQENGYFKASQPPSNNPEKYNEGYKLPSIKQNNEKVRYESNPGNNYVQPPSTDHLVQRKQGF